jgi:hypothetical protein
MNLFQRLRRGKNAKFLYYIRNYIKIIEPGCLYRFRLPFLLKQSQKRADNNYIVERVNYYNKLQKPVSCGSDAIPLNQFKLKGNIKVYYFDTFEYTRYFNKNYKINYCFGDITKVPAVPSIVKSRPVNDHNTNSILLNLNKIRHFTFLNDNIPFEKKKDMLIFRGDIIYKPHRIKFMEMYFDNPHFDIGEVPKRATYNKKWCKPKISILDHLKFKFILTLEGNDVASNLKWVMSSNSIAVMPRPKYETWFMEGKLQPDYHYIEINPEYTDVEEKLNYYIQHPEKAQEIINHAHEYISQFRNKKREKIISLLVLDKYFTYTGQKMDL